MKHLQFYHKEKLDKIKKDKLNYQLKKQHSAFQHEDIDKLNLVPKEYTNIHVMSNIKNQNIFMSLNLPPPIIILDKNIEYLQENILKIVNVYQSEYFNSIKATGLGDFIRGTYFIMQFCQLYNIEYDMQINHPISKWLHRQIPELESVTVEKESESIEEDEENITSIHQKYVTRFFDKVGFDPENKPTQDDLIEGFCDYLREQTFERNVANVYAINFPMDDTISEEHKQSMIHFLEPTHDMKELIRKTLEILKLNAKKYIVIHVRSGDQKLIYNEELGSDYLSQIIIELKKIIRPEYKYLLLSDSIELKKKISLYFPKIRVTLDAITHCGEGIKLVEENLKNTILDFYLMAYSGKIFSYSCYLHGTGFSKWCAKTFSIPYTCTMIK